jgi:hypothetical protein
MIFQSKKMANFKTIQTCLAPFRISMDCLGQLDCVGCLLVDNLTSLLFVRE